MNLTQRLIVLSCTMVCCAGSAYAKGGKDDSLTRRDLDNVVVSATRTSRQIHDVPVPVSVIKGKTVERIGSLRLNEVLAEETGLMVVQDHGAGIQMQGLSTDYVLILVDGEPIVGRTKGNLDLTRLVVGNIERIEVVKGPSSSLFGSEAMGGIINIITKKGTREYTGALRARYRRYNTLDVTAEAGKQHDRFGWYVFANRLSSDGYFAENATSNITKTIAPFSGYTMSSKLSYRFSPALELVLNARYFTEDQRNFKLITTTESERMIGEKSNRNDLSITPTLYWTPAAGRKFQLRNHVTTFGTRTDYHYTDDGGLYDASYFRQLFNRSELQYDHEFNSRHLTSVGIGNVLETVDATRYDVQNAFNQMYVFGQHQWRPLDPVNVVAGFRYDKHNQYADRLSPKLAAGWRVHRTLSVQASVAGGYKAPSFEQLLLNFTNPIAGYSVMGSRVAEEGIRKLQDEGQIQTILIDPSTIGEIRAESSVAYNLGFRLTPADGLHLSANLFRNNLRDMIDFNTVAIKTNGGNIFSYFNRNRVRTQGLEVQGGYTLPFNLTVSAGYQYLEAVDLEVWEKLQQGRVYQRDPETNLDIKVAPEAYGGLYNRSRHTGNIKLFYENKKLDFDISVRGIFRGRFGSGLDVNGNGILDNDAEYAAGYTLWNASARKFYKQFTAEAGAHNIFSAKTPFDPTTPPLNWYFGLAWQFRKG